VLEGYESHFLVYRLTKFRGDAIKSMPLVAKDIASGDPVADTHPAAKMIANPNPRISMDELEFRAELFLCMAGDAYWYINQVGDSVRLDPLRSDRVSIKAYKGELLYLYTLPGEEPVPFEEEEIVHFKNYNPSSDLFGQPVLRANAKLVDTGNAISDFQYHSMKNGIWPSGTFNTAELTDKQYKRIEDQLKEHKEGPPNARKLMIIEDGKGFVPATPTPAEMDFMGGSNLTNQELCVGFGVYAEAMGLIPAKYENMRQALRATWENTMIPEKTMLEGTLNTQLAPHFDGIYFEYDMSQTIPMIEARKENADEGKLYFDMGISTKAINERLNLGFDEDDCPEKGMLPVNLLAVDATREEPVEPVDKERSIRSIDGVKDLHYRATDRKRQGWENGVAEKVKVLFAAESSAAVKAVKNGHVDTDRAVESQRSNWVKTLTAVYRAVIEDFGAEVSEQLTPRMADVNSDHSINDIDSSAMSRRRSLGVQSDDDHIERSLQIEHREFDPWAAEVKKYVTTRVANEVKEIQKTTKMRIRKVVLDGTNEGQSLTTIARNVKASFDTWEGVGGSISTSRSMTIARTEVHNSAGYGMHESARQSGVAKKKGWLDAGDDRVRPAHVSNTGQGWIAFDDAYSNGAMFPGDGTDDVNCRCVEMYKDR